MTTPPVPSPQLFFETASAYQRTAALRAAVDLDVFTAIARGANDADAIAQQCEAAPRGIRILCDTLATIGFLIKEDGHYRLTPDSAVFLDRRSMAYVGTTLDFICSAELTAHFAQPAETVRRGGAAAQGTLGPEDPVWVHFARAMVPAAMPPAQVMAGMAEFSVDKPARVLDIAAGHGMYGISMALRHPSVEVVAVDWKPVLELARSNAERLGVGGRYHLRPGSAFEVDLGEGYDLILLPNFLHHFDVPTCEVMLRRLRAALGPDGRLFTLEIVPEADRIRPAAAASFAYTMLNATPAGDAYTFADLEGMLVRSGFSRNEERRMPTTMNSLVISQV